MSNNNKNNEYDDLLKGIENPDRTTIVWDKICEVWDDLTEQYPNLTNHKKACHIAKHIGDFMRVDSPEEFRDMGSMSPQNVTRVLTKRGRITARQQEKGGEA